MKKFFYFVVISLSLVLMLTGCQKSPDILEDKTDGAVTSSLRGKDFSHR